MVLQGLNNRGSDNLRQLLNNQSDLLKLERMELEKASALQDQLQRMSGLSGKQLQDLMASGQVPGGLSVNPPSAANSPFAASQYAANPAVNFGNSPWGQWLANNPDERQALEMAYGGQIVGASGANLMIQPHPSGSFTGGGQSSDYAITAQSMFGSLERAAGFGQGLQASQDLYRNALMPGLTNVLSPQPCSGVGGYGGGYGGGGYGGGGGDGEPGSISALRAQGHSLAYDPADFDPRRGKKGTGTPQAFAVAGAPGGFGGFGGAPGLGGGFGGVPALGGGFGGIGAPAVGPGSGQPLVGVGGDNAPFQGNDDVTGILNDGGLTVEDKITLMIMAIMKKMDKEIERMGQYINSLQQQQDAKKGGLAYQGGASNPVDGPAGGQTGSPNGSSPSIDVETMKLKRLIDKRSQMFDMLRQIIDRYNQTAKGIIDQIGRS